MSKKYQVYFIQSGGGFRAPVKIGVSHDIDKRLSELQTGNPFPLKVIGAIDCINKKEAHDLENYFHRCLKSKRMQGEWFKNKNIRIMDILKTYLTRYKARHEFQPVEKLNCKDGIIKRLRTENAKLKKQNSKLKSDMEEYLDGEFSYETE